MDVGEWRLGRVCGVAAGYNLRLELELPSSGVIIDFHPTGIRTLRSSPLGRQAAKILGKLGPEKFLMAGRGHLDWISSHRSCQEQIQANDSK